MDCIRDSNGDIEIYGLSDDVFSAGSLQVEIKVTGFTTPKTKTTSFAWDVMIYRFGTNTLIADYDGTSSPVTLTAGSISNISLSPYLTNSCTSNLVSGITTFYMTSFTTSHEIPASGTIDVVYTNGNPSGEFFSGSGGHDCLVMTHQNDDIKCSTATTTATITVSNNAVAATSWTIITRNVLSSTTFSIGSIKSETTASVTIDENTSPGVTITHPTDAFQVLDGFIMEANDGTVLGDASADIGGSDTIMFYVDDADNTNTDLEISTTAVFYVPFLKQSSQSNT